MRFNFSLLFLSALLFVGEGLFVKKALAQANPSIGTASLVGKSIKTAVEAALYRSAPKEKERPPIEFQGGSLALNSLNLNDLDGKAVSPAELKNKRVVLYFWSIYCRGCGEFLQELESLKKEFEEEDVAFLNVHLFESNKARILSELAALGLGIRVLLAPSAFQDLYSVRVLPTTLVFDNSHKLMTRIEGKRDKEGLRLTLFGKIPMENGVPAENRASLEK